MKNLRPFFVFLLLFQLIGGAVFGQAATTKLPRSTPEAEGISSQSILNFLEAIEGSKHEFHSFMMLRHGQVVAEAWWSPYRADLRHTLYSCSKSFTATAVGFAVSEGKLALTDKVVSFFPEKAPAQVSPNLAALTIHDLLSMTAGQDPDPSFSIAVAEEDWIKAFFNTPIVDKPGTKFRYNSLATYMAGAIVQKVTGQTLVEYLRPRLFEPLGIEGMDWESDPLGYNVGGWGLRVKTEDMAKFAQLFLQKGMWNGKQVLPAKWVEQATTQKILQEPGIAQAERDKNDWAQGYCYQMWRSRHNSYRGDGAYGQLMLVLPEQDVVIAVTAETPDMQAEMNLVWDYLLPGIYKDYPIEEDQATEALNAKLPKLALSKPVGNPTPAASSSKYGNKLFSMEPNEMGLKAMHFGFGMRDCNLLMSFTNGEIHTLNFAQNGWHEATTEKKGPYLVSAIKGSMDGLPPSKVAGSYAWLDDHTLQLKLRYIESPHSEQYTCHFSDDGLKVEFEKSNDFGGKKTMLTGK